MPAVGSHTRNFTVLFITSLGILAFLLFYIFAYIPANERRLNSRHYRVLHRIGHNLNTTITNYATNVGSSHVSDKVKKFVKEKSLPDTADLNNSLETYLRENAGKKEFKGKFGLELFLKENDSRHVYNNRLFDYSQHQGNYFLDFHSKINDITLKELEDENKKLPAQIQNKQFHVKIPVDSLFTPLVRWDTFTDFIVLRPEENARAKNNKGTNLEILYNSRQHAELIPVDTLAYWAHKAGGTQPADVFIAGVPYKLFSLSQRVGAGEKWFLFGTMPTEKYENESRAIPADIISFSALAFVILLMAFPFLKLLLMNQQERLYAKDVVLSFLSLFVGLALVVLLLFDCYVFYGIDRNTESLRLKNLSKNLENNLHDEISLLLKQIKIFNNCPPGTEDCNFRTIGYWKEVKKSQVDRNEKKYFPHIQRVFWTDKEGMMIRSWKSKIHNNLNNARVPVSSREYFKIINSGGGYLLPDDSTKFALESITSFTDGEKYAVISTSSSAETEKYEIPVVALATKLVSLYKPILPPGYGFCVINKEGKVLFHQNDDLNLNENFLEEINFDSRLRAALFGETAAEVEQKYQGKQQQIYVKPLKGLPFFLVTYVDKAFHHGFNVNLLMVTAMFLSLYLFSVALLSALILFVNKGFSGILFKWLWPQKHKNLYYAQIFGAIIGTLFLMLFSISTKMPITSFFIFIFSTIYILIFIIYKLLPNPPYARATATAYLGTGLILLGLNFICLAINSAVFYKALIFQVYVILLFATIHFLSGKANWVELLKKINLPNRVYRFLIPVQRRDFGVYVLMVGSWLILTSGLPAFALFRVAYNYEAELMLRYNQMYLAQGINEIKDFDPQIYTASDSVKLAKTTRLPYTRFFYSTHLHSESGPSQPAHVEYAQEALQKKVRLKNSVVQNHLFEFKTSFVFNPEFMAPNESEFSFLNNLISLFRPIFNNVLSNEYYLKASEVNLWEPLPKEKRLKFSYPGLNQTINLISHLPDFNVPGLFYKNPAISNQPDESLLNRINKSAWFFWADMILLVAFLGWLIFFLVKRLFNFDLLKNLKNNLFEATLLDPGNKINLFIISLPFAPDLKNLILAGRYPKKITIEEFDLKDFDLTLNPEIAKQNLEDTLQLVKAKIECSKLCNSGLEKTNWADSALIIKNFDHDPFSKASLEFKYYIIKEIKKCSETKIFLQSGLHPECWEEKILAEENKPAPSGYDKLLNPLLQELLTQLNTFSKVYLSIQDPGHGSHLLNNNRPESGTGDEVKKALINLINEECAVASYLQKTYAPVLIDYVLHYEGDIPLNGGSIFSRMQSLAHLYYRSLWDFCSEEEHYFLYDMAQDGLVNPKNVKVLSSLLGKGLLVIGQDGLLKIMNESFRTFILNAINPSEALRFERSKAHASSWEVYKTPLVIIMIGAVLFFFFTQKNSWANIIAILTATSTFVSILPRLSFLIPSFMVSKEAKVST